MRKRRLEEFAAELQVSLFEVRSTANELWQKLGKSNAHVERLVEEVDELQTQLAERDRTIAKLRHPAGKSIGTLHVNVTPRITAADINRLGVSILNVGCKVGLGDIVLYRLTERDAWSVNKRRDDTESHITQHRKAATGVQVHVGFEVKPGDVVPAVVVGGVFYAGGRIDLKCMLNGTDTFWVPDVEQGNRPGEWQHR